MKGEKNILQTLGPWVLWFAVLVLWAFVLVFVDKNSVRYSVLHDDVGTILVAIFMAQWVNRTFQEGGVKDIADIWRPILTFILVLVALALVPFLEMFTIRT